MATSPSPTRPGRWLVQGQASKCRWGCDEALQVADKLRASGFGVFWARRDGQLDYELMHFAAVVAAETEHQASREVHSAVNDLLAETPDICQVAITTVIELVPTLR